MPPAACNAPTPPDKPAGRRGLAVLGVLALLAAAGVALFQLLQYTDYSELRREGPPAMVEHHEARQLWLLVTYEERRHIGFRGRGERFGTRTHIELRCHDRQSGQKLWTRRLLTLGEHDNGHGARARILGQDGELVWLFVDHQPVAVAAADGAVRATGLDIASKNPALQALVPTELDYYTFDRGLVFIAADGRRHRIAVPGYAATPYAPPNEEEFSRRKYMSTRWNGGFEMREFMTPQVRPGERWYGLFTAAEAREAGDDGFGSNLKDPGRTWRRDADARRSFWTARIGRTREFSEGSHERLLDVTRLPQSPDWLQAGLLVDAGKKTPLVLDAGELLVLHRTRIDKAGRAALTRVRIGDGDSVQSEWTATLPFTELNNRWQFPGQLLMLGQAQIDDDGVTRHQEFIAAVDLRSGQQRGWNLTLDRPWAPPDSAASFTR